MAGQQAQVIPYPPRAGGGRSARHGQDLPNPRKNLRAHYSGARKADPRPITGKESPTELLEHAFSAYVGRQERTAFELMRRSMEVDASIFLTLSGAMTPAGLHQSCIIPLIEKGIISALTTTGANLYHDAHRIIGHAIREVNPNAGISSTAWPASSASTTWASGRRRCSTPTGSSPPSCAAPSSSGR